LVILVMNISNHFAFMCFLICPTTDSSFWQGFMYYSLYYVLEPIRREAFWGP
jgi:hypothetical protein